MSPVKMILFALFALLPFSVHAQSETDLFNVKPNRCIALHQGQTCFMSVRFEWQTPETGDYCLFDDFNSSPLICWSGNGLASFRHEFESSKNVVYEIREKQNQQLILQTLVKISWVYKSNNRSKSRWRLF